MLRLINESKEYCGLNDDRYGCCDSKQVKGIWCEKVLAVSFKPTEAVREECKWRQPYEGSHCERQPFLLLQCSEKDSKDRNDCQSEHRGCHVAFVWVCWVEHLLPWKTPILKRKQPYSRVIACEINTQYGQFVPADCFELVCRLLVALERNIRFV